MILVELHTFLGCHCFKFLSIKPKEKVKKKVKRLETCLMRNPLHITHDLIHTVRRGIIYFTVRTNYSFIIVFTLIEG